MIVYIPISILIIILFIFLIKWHRKNGQKFTFKEAEKYEDGVIVQQIKTRKELFMAVQEWHQDAKMAERRYGHISVWNVSKVTNMKGAFRMRERFNEDISKWDVSNVTNMSGMFRNATTFNQDISSWNVSNVTDMRQMFYGASEFNQNIGSWDVSSVINMDDILTGADKLSVKEKVERLINKWDFSENINLANFFSGADIDNYIEYRSIEDIISKDPVYQNKEEADAALSIEKNVF